MVDPVARFSPAPGIIVDRTEKSVAITGNLELYGDEATIGRALQIQQVINQTWTMSFSDGYDVKCNIFVRLRLPGSSAGNATQIEAKKMSGPSCVDSFGPGFAREMTLNANETGAFSWVPAHEFGHILGMQDRYSEGIISRISSNFGGPRTTTVPAKYKDNLMGSYWGVLGSQNVSDLASENQPSPYWIHNDRQVLEWVTAHSSQEIDALSAADKVAAIKTLMTGWIDDDDMAAIGKICKSVTKPADGKAIREGIVLYNFTSIGQRTDMRMFYANMP
jgi:hypothetical protein